MIKVKDIVQEIIQRDHEALFSLSRGILNLSSYARLIHKEVEKRTMKDVKENTIITALSRLKMYVEGTQPLMKDVKVDGLTIKTPLIEIVYEKSRKNLDRLVVLEKELNLTADEWFMFSQNTKSIIILCSESKINKVKKHMETEPIFILNSISAIGVALSPKYHSESNVVFSLLHKVAEKRIPLVETISTWGEVIFVFKQEYLSEMVNIFQSK